MAQRGRPRKNVQSEEVRPEFKGPEVPQQIAVTDGQAVDRPSVSAPRTGRKKRTPINGYRDVLKVDGQDPNYHYAWIGDNMVPKFEAADYEFVTHDVVVGDRKINAASQLGSKISMPSGNGRTLFLMRQLLEYYNEDMAAYHAEIDAGEATMIGNLTKEAGRYGTVEMDVTKSFKGKRIQ